MMIDVYAVEGHLGRNRAELMERFTTILLDWAKDKTPPEAWIKTEAQQQVLAVPAFEMLDVQFYLGVVEKVQN